MLWLHLEKETENIVVTLSEKVSLVNPVYLFVFKHVTTKALISFKKTEDDDLSPFGERFNEFSVSTSSLFTEPGQYIYKVYEIQSEPFEGEGGEYFISENGDQFRAEGATVRNELENGKMNLLPAVGVSRTEYSTNTTYKTYQG